MDKLGLLEAYLDSANAHAYIKDEEGHFLLVNQAFADFAKRPKEQIIGRTDYDFVSKDVADGFREADREVIESGKPQDYEVAFELGGRKLTVTDHKFPISVEGHPRAVAGIAFLH